MGAHFVPTHHKVSLVPAYPPTMAVIYAWFHQVPRHSQWDIHGFKLSYTAPKSRTSLAQPVLHAALTIGKLWSYVVLQPSQWATQKKKENQIFLIYKKIQKGSVAKSHEWLTASSYEGKYLRISSYIVQYSIRKPFLIYWLCNRSHLNLFPHIWGKFRFLFYQCRLQIRLSAFTAHGAILTSIDFRVWKNNEVAPIFCRPNMTVSCTCQILGQVIVPGPVGYVIF